MLVAPHVASGVAIRAELFGYNHHASAVFEDIPIHCAIAHDLVSYEFDLYRFAMIRNSIPCFIFSPDW
jgi:hypothetical protein